jgi:hypothetical protein
MFRYRNTPERLAFRDVEGQAQAAQISEARASQAAAREDLRNAAQHLEPDEAFDLLTAHYAARVDAKILHMVMQRLERAADALQREQHLTTNGPALARVAMGGE